jgi:hypothetical protein
VRRVSGNVKLKKVSDINHCAQDHQAGGGPRTSDAVKGISKSAVNLGSVSALWCYPVKSMMGEEMKAAELTQRGIMEIALCSD